MPHARRRPALRGLGALALVAIALADCRETSAPAGPAAQVIAISATTLSAIAGLVVADSVTVKVEDAEGHAVPGEVVTFVTLGGGLASPASVTTGSNGEARTAWTLSAAVGTNQVIAQAGGVTTTVVFTATAVAGPAAAVSITPHTLRLPVGTNASQLVGATTDQFGNAVAGKTTYIPRDPSLVSVDTNGNVSVLRRDGTTYVVATNGKWSDSAYVVVLNTGDSPCFGFGASDTLSVGTVMTTGFAANGSICVQGSAGSEFAVVPYFNSPVPSASIEVNVEGYGITVPGPLGDVRPNLAAQAAGTGATLAATLPGSLRPNDAFHQRMLVQEARELPVRAAGARLWYRQQQAAFARTGTSPNGTRANGVSAAASSIGIPSGVVPSVGDLWSLNVNAVDYCVNPTMRTGQVVAVSNTAIIVADTLNPAGGFTTADYQGYATMIDTMIYPMDTTNFGGPSDIDHNHRIVVFFTSAVNELSAAVLGGEILGFYYSRDLFPLVGPLGACPGSNVGEMFYMMVPDSLGLVSNTSIPKSYVSTNTPSVIAHEFQHLINASRRMYINDAPSLTEELWLNEGLSHIAEELLFYRSSGAHPLQGLGAQIWSPPLSTAFSEDQLNNFDRFYGYLAVPETQAPIGATPTDASLQVRGAIWSFLRYAADQNSPTNETGAFCAVPYQGFWCRLVNSQTTGVANLDQVTGTDVYGMMRNWAISVFLNGLVPTLPQYQDPSWNFRAACPPETGCQYSPHTFSLTDSEIQAIGMNAGGVAFVRFGVAAGQSALILAGVPGWSAAPATLQWALVRTK